MWTHESVVLNVYKYKIWPSYLERRGIYKSDKPFDKSDVCIKRNSLLCKRSFMQNVILAHSWERPRAVIFALTKESRIRGRDSSCDERSSIQPRIRFTSNGTSLTRLRFPHVLLVLRDARDCTLARPLATIHAVLFARSRVVQSCRMLFQAGNTQCARAYRL